MKKLFLAQRNLPFSSTEESSLMYTFLPNCRTVTIVRYTTSLACSLCMHKMVCVEMVCFLLLSWASVFCWLTRTCQNSLQENNPTGTDVCLVWVPCCMLFHICSNSWGVNPCITSDLCFRQSAYTEKQLMHSSSVLCAYIPPWSLTWRVLQENPYHSTVTTLPQDNPVCIPW